MTSALISCTELKNIIKDPHTKILDGSYNLPPFDMGIPSAVDFDIDDTADSAAPLAHTIPTPAIFAEKVGTLGISNKDLVVVYDRAGMAMSASRVWWMFRLFGHDNVRVLNGGLPAWVAAGHTLTPKNSTPSPASFAATFRPELFKSVQDMSVNITQKKFTVLDARDARRYSGDMPEPRPGMESGHIPGAYSLPFNNLIDPDTSELKNKNDLTSAIETIGIDLSKPLACSCGSGVTACVVALGLYELGHKDVAIYGGSWAEWGSNPSLPKSKGGQP